MPAKSLYSGLKEGAYSHVYNRSVESKTMFTDKQDYETFLGYLNDCLSPPPSLDSTKAEFTIKGRTYTGVPHQPKNYFNKIELIAYSLKPNHFHLILHQMTKGAQSDLMRSLCTRYSIYYNKKHNRKGSLFDGPYRSFQIEDLSQLAPLSRYLHTHNQKGKDFSREYSSYAEYIGRRQTPWIKPGTVLMRVGNYQDFAENHDLDNDRQNLLKGLLPEEKTTEEAPTGLERTVQEAKKVESFKAQRSKTPEFVATMSLIFALLFTLGVRNVRDTEAQYLADSTPQKVPQVIQTPGAAEKPQEMQEQVAGVEDEPVITQSIIITVKDGSDSVNLREKPSIYSPKVGEAYDGNIFELVEENSGWYGIKLEDGLAFVSAKYAEIVEEETP
jgi:putative transposase